MPDQNLISYIQESLKLGDTKEQIQKALIDSGWKAEAIVEGFRSLDDTIPEPPLIQTSVTASPSPDSVSQESFFSLLEKYFTLIGIGGIIISGVIFFVYFNTIINSSIAMYIAIYEVIIGFIGSFILFILTKAFKINNSNLGKALFFSGSISLSAALIQLLNLLPIPSYIAGLLSVGLFIGSFILLIKLYLTTVGRGIALGITNVIVTGIIGVIIAFIFTLFGLFKIQSLFQSSDNMSAVETGQLNPNTSFDTNQEVITDNNNEERDNNVENNQTLTFIGKETSIQDCGDLITDRDGYTYKTVQIGTQCWMAENLKTKTKPNSIALTNLSDDSERDCISRSLDNIRGTELDCEAGNTLYTWEGAMGASTLSEAVALGAGSQGICPTDWHIPTDGEQNILDQYVTKKGMICDANRDSISEKNCDPGAVTLGLRGSSGFDWIRTGFFSYKKFTDYEQSGIIWSSSTSESPDPLGRGYEHWGRRIMSPGYEISESIDRTTFSSGIKASVRCIKNQTN